MAARYNHVNDVGFFTKVRFWTKTAIMCYERGCDCKGCIYEGAFDSETKCQCKASVLESVRVFGRPFDRKNSVIGGDE